MQTNFTKKGFIHVCVLLMYLVMKSVRSSSSTPVVLEWVELTLWTLGLLEILDAVFRPGKNPPLSLDELPNELKQRL